MKEKRMEWEQFFAATQAKQLLEEKEALRALANSDEIRKLGAFLAGKDEKTQSACEAAIGGDTRAFAQLLEEAACNPEGAEVMARLKERLGCEMGR